MAMRKKCPYCEKLFEYPHIYQCEALHEKAMKKTKKGWLGKPLGALSHTGDEPGICNCQICIEKERNTH
jgi:hypothetical protein